MSLDKSALELVQDTVLAAENQANDHTAFEIATLPDAMSIFSLEKYQEQRNRFRATFATNTLADYINYVNQNNGSESYINAKNMSANTIFDIGDIDEPGHCEHKAGLLLVKSPEYSAILDINGQRLSQRALSEFLEDWSHYIDVLDANGEEMETRTAINSIRRITIESLLKGENQISNMSESKSTLETIEAKSGDAPLPAWIYFECKPYEGFNNRTFAMRISVSTAHNDPKLRATIQTIEKHKAEMGSELAALIKEGSPDINTYLGTLYTD